MTGQLLGDGTRDHLAQARGELGAQLDQECLAHASQCRHQRLVNALLERRLDALEHVDQNAPRELGLVAGGNRRGRLAARPDLVGEQRQARRVRAFRATHALTSWCVTACPRSL